MERAVAWDGLFEEALAGAEVRAYPES